MWDTLYENRNLLLGVIVVLVLMTLSCSAGALKTMLGVDKVNDSLSILRHQEGMGGRLEQDKNFLIGTSLRYQAVRGDTGYAPSSGFGNPSEGFLGGAEPPVFYQVGNLAAAKASMQMSSSPRTRSAWKGAETRGVDGFRPGDMTDSRGVHDDALASMLNR
jgi:hypothetical protein